MYLSKFIQINYFNLLFYFLSACELFHKRDRLGVYALVKQGKERSH